jgi:hypothetical protein
MPSRILCKLVTAFLLAALIFSGGCHESGTQVSESAESVETLHTEGVAEKAPETEAIQSETAHGKQQADEVRLFDGKTLENWKKTDFGGQGDVYVEHGAIYLEMGNDMTGITWDAPLPFKTNYEITLEAMRVDGSDFFCGLTFPVGENFCSLIFGGWGGTLCGLSNIDYYDAANNETTCIVSFEDDKWYHVRLHVRPGRITAWLEEEGEEPLVDIDITGRKIDTRAEMDYCQPMGVATWQTSGAIRNFYMRRLEE